MQMAQEHGTVLNLSEKRLSAASQNRNHGRARFRRDAKNRDQRMGGNGARRWSRFSFLGAETG
jgi:hypothetical protein